MKQSIHETLKGLRLDKHVTQEQAAEAIGVTVNTIQNWESGRSVPTSVNLRALCDYYECETLKISPQTAGKEELIDFPTVLFEYDYESLLRLMNMKFTSAEQELFSYLVMYNAITLNFAGRILNEVEIAKIPIEIVKKYSPTELLVTSRNIVQKLEGAKLESVVKWLQLSDGRMLDAVKGTREQIEIVLRDFGFFRDAEASADMRRFGYDYYHYDSKTIDDILTVIIHKPIALCYENVSDGKMYLSETLAFLHKFSSSYVWNVIRAFDGLLWHINYIDVNTEESITDQEEYDKAVNSKKFKVSEFLSLISPGQIDAKTLKNDDIGENMRPCTIQVTPIGARMFMWLMRHNEEDDVQKAASLMYPEKMAFYLEETERLDGCYDWDELKNLRPFEQSAW